MSPEDVMVEEYRALKAEQVARIHTRDNLIYATLAALGAVLWAMLQTGNPDLLLAVGPPTLVLGWTYLANDSKIDRIRWYIRRELGPTVEALTSPVDRPTLELLGWESQRNVPGAGFRRVGQFAVNVALFAGPSIAATAAWIWQAQRGDDAAWVGAVLFFEHAGAAAIVWFAAVNTWRRSNRRQESAA